MAAERRATFDCCGALIDWDGGIRRVVASEIGSCKPAHTHWLWFFGRTR